MLSKKNKKRFWIQRVSLPRRRVETPPRPVPDSSGHIIGRRWNSLYSLICVDPGSTQSQNFKGFEAIFLLLDIHILREKYLRSSQQLKMSIGNYSHETKTLLSRFFFFLLLNFTEQKTTRREKIKVSIYSKALCRVYEHFHCVCVCVSVRVCVCV